MTDYTDLINRLSGIYRIPIKDGLGAVGAGEEPDNPNEFVRKFEGLPPIHGEAAAALRELTERIENARQEASETHTDWRSRCYAILSSLGMDFGDREFEMPDEQRRSDRLRTALDQILTLTHTAGKTVSDYVGDEPGNILTQRDKAMIGMVAEPFRLARIAIDEDDRRRR